MRKWQSADYFEGQRGRAFERLLISLIRRAESIGLKYEKSSYRKSKGISDRVRGEKEGAKDKRNAEDVLVARKQVVSGQIVKNKRIVSENKRAKHKTEEKSQSQLIATPLTLKSDSVVILNLWWVRILLGVIVGIVFGITIVLIYPEGDLTLVNSTLAILFLSLSCGFAGLIAYPHKLLPWLIIIGFFVGGGLAINEIRHLSAFIGFGAQFGIPLGALASRILHWRKAM